MKKITDKAIYIYEEMLRLFPNAKCELHYESVFQLLISTVLSAQTTDKSVNSVADALYKDYPDIDAFLTLSQDEIADKIKVLGLYKNKSKSIYKLVRQLKSNYDGCVPSDMKELIKLSGVGRKTASVVLAEGFAIPAFPVDTHVNRLALRLGLSKGNTTDKVSNDLMVQFPKELWIKSHHLFINYGRKVCTSRNPKCDMCAFKEICTFDKEENRRK